jgi:hypothetical protein
MSDNFFEILKIEDFYVLRNDNKGSREYIMSKKVLIGDVVSINRNEVGDFEIIELCENNCGAVLTKTQLLKMAEEIKQFAEMD